MSANGYFSLPRGWQHHPVFRNAGERCAYAWLVERAAWKDTPFNSNGRHIIVRRGQLAVSVRLLSQEWGSAEWSKSRVQRFLSRLKSASLIGTESGTGRIVVTINDYSDNQHTPGGRAGHVAGRQAGRERDTKEEGNNSKEPEIPLAAPSGSLRKIVFERGKALLVGKPDERSKLVTADRAGSIINGWLGTFGETAVIQALTKAEAAGEAFSGIPYVRAILDRQSGGRGSKQPAAPPARGMVIDSPEWEARQAARGLSQGGSAA